MEIIYIAKICHEANRIYCESIKDYSQVPWNRAADWQCESAIAGVKFLLDNPGADSAATHTNWMKDKIADGWRYGEVKDAEKKTHPCIKDYCDLPKEQRAKDALFLGIVRALAPYYSAAQL